MVTSDENKPLLRDEKGHFVPGHPPTFKEFKPGQNVGGRPKHIATQVRDALKLAEDAMPQILNDMIARTKDPEVPHNVRQQASEYLIDRIYGKANQPISSNAPWEIIVTYGGRLDQQLQAQLPESDYTDVSEDNDTQSQSSQPEG